MPSLSLLVPVYNGAQFCEAFFANLEQLEQPFDEVLFVNDGSTDETDQILRQHGATVIQLEKNGGLSNARNVLMGAHQGDFFKFQDIDDPMPLDIVPNIKAALSENPPPRTIFFGDFDTYHFAAPPVRSQVSTETLEQDPMCYFIDNFVQLNAVVYPAEIAEIPFQTDLSLYEDKAHIIAAAASGYRFAHTPNLWGIWKIRANSTMTGRSWNDADTNLARMIETMPAPQTQAQAQALVHYAVYKAWLACWNMGRPQNPEAIEKALVDKISGHFPRLHLTQERWVFQALCNTLGLGTALRAKLAWAKLRPQTAKHQIQSR
ncbi:glycosyltransferase family A protein [uncultured Pelagimonas sp.]|uniref:glycosyltransferase family 2 protein n=1 Tax=uncultured Pelagimonas sp. TaxID=1618102 RepID=UPI00262D7D81|nr:glycosyltransferase family A protein [uncultured Pelagimonas sp.]